MNYAVDNGIANAYQITVTPPLLANVPGNRWSIMIAQHQHRTIDAQYQRGWREADLLPNGDALAGGEMQAGAIVTVIYDGVGYQMQNIAANLLAAAKAYYVNASTGSDTAFDGTQPTVVGTKGPFATIQKAISTAVRWNQNGFNIDIIVADGFYPRFYLQPVNGSGGIVIIGNDANPAACLVHSTAGEAMECSSNGYSIHGFKVQSDGPAPPAHGAQGIRISTVMTSLWNIDFGACADAHIMVDSGAVLGVAGLDGQMDTTWTVSGSSPIHMLISANSYVFLGKPALKVLNNVTVNNWVVCQVDSTLFGSYASQTLTGTVTGQKYTVTMNGAVATGQGINYFPGTIAGTTSTGGQYS